MKKNEKDARDKLIEGGYFLPLAFALLLTIILGAVATAQTPQEVLKYADSIGIKNPDIVARQAILETGGFECRNCSLDGNNVFGIRYEGKYLRFASWRDSVDYSLRWQRKSYAGGDYYDFLDCIWLHRDGRCARYASDPNYVDKLKRIKL
jgi:hypothetical protein